MVTSDDKEDPNQKNGESIVLVLDQNMMLWSRVQC
jgi:hypothetical protein